MVEHSEYYTYYRDRLLGLCPTLSEGLIEELSLGGQEVHFALGWIQSSPWSRQTMH